VERRGTRHAPPGATRIAVLQRHAPQCIRAHGATPHHSSVPLSSGRSRLRAARTDARRRWRGPARGRPQARPAEFSLGHGWRPSGTWRLCCASTPASRVCVRHVIRSNSVGLLPDRTDGRRLWRAQISRHFSRDSGMRSGRTCGVLTGITDSKPRARAAGQDEGGVRDHDDDDGCEAAQLLLTCCAEC
jgi:hypothetical protein